MKANFHFSHTKLKEEGEGEQDILNSCKYCTVYNVESQFILSELIWDVKKQI
jgi:hypothetical protein